MKYLPFIFLFFTITHSATSVVDSAGAASDATDVLATTDPLTVQENDVVVGFVSWEEASRTVTVADTASSNTITLTGYTAKNYASVYSRVYKHTITSAEARGDVIFEADFGSTTYYVTLQIYVIRSTLGAPADSVYADSGGSSTHPASPLISLSGDDVVVVGMIKSYSDGIANQEIGGVSPDDIVSLSAYETSFYKVYNSAQTDIQAECDINIGTWTASIIAFSFSGGGVSQWTLTMANDGHGTTIPASDTTVDSAALIPISATPSLDYYFDYWSITAGTPLFNADSSNCSLMTGNATIQANFISSPWPDYTLDTVSVLGCSGGTSHAGVLPVGLSYDSASACTTYAVPADGRVCDSIVSTGSVSGRSVTTADTVIHSSLAENWIDSLYFRSAGDSIEITALDFPGNGSAVAYFDDPHTNGLPAYGTGGAGVTYITKCYPKEKDPVDFYGQIWWGDRGDGVGYPDVSKNYYAFHPFDTDPITWEIACGSEDITGDVVVFDQWYTQVFRCWISGGNRYHEYYWDWPDTSHNIKYMRTGSGSDPTDPIVLLGNNTWNEAEQWYGMLRGIQIYDTLFSMDSVTIAGLIGDTTSTTLWYANINPTPHDLTDHSGNGHDFAWDVTSDSATTWSGKEYDPDAESCGITVMIGDTAFQCTSGVAFSVTVENNGCGDSIINLSAFQTGIDLDSVTGEVSGTSTDTFTLDSVQLVFYACDGDSTDTSWFILTSIDTSGELPTPIIDSVRDSTALRDSVYLQAARPLDTIKIFGSGFSTEGENSLLNLNSSGSVTGTVLSVTDDLIIAIIPSGTPRGWYSIWFRTNDMISGVPKRHGLLIKRPGGL